MKGVTIHPNKVLKIFNDYLKNLTILKKSEWNCPRGCISRSIYLNFFLNSAGVKPVYFLKQIPKY